MNLYDYWSNYYANQKPYRDDEENLRDVISELIQKGYMSYNVIIDGTHKKQMLIYEHIDPIEGKQNDFRAICLDKDNVHWGNIISLEDGREYMAMTRGDWNGAYNKYRVRELTDEVVFAAGRTVHMKCILADKGFYDESSFTNEQNVFEDKELRAALIQYNKDTKTLSLFDDVYINNNHYKIVKIDSHTLKDHDEEFGVLQLVVIDTPFGEIYKNECKDHIKGVVMAARVKDKILNSISRELICNYNMAKRGDYINFTYDRDGKGKMATETYLIVNKPTMNEGYDTSLMYLCESKANILNDKGDVVTTPLYFENNRSRIDKVTDNEFVKLKNSSFLFVAQHNDVTERLRNKVKRIIVDGVAYEITGTEPHAKGLLALGLELSQINASDDNIELGVANYYSQMEEIIKDESTESTGSIIEENGYEDLQVTYPNTYILEGASSGVVWSIDVDWCELTQDGTRCTLLFMDRCDVGKVVVLTANYMGNTFTKTVNTVGLG